jgi:2-polyprenyl-3-methyl-5-hydroxy-6-metoxy-1,4-benzoquinol methylase
MLSSRYRNDGKETLRLNDVQLKARAVVNNKIASGQYHFESVPCVICHGSDFEVLSEKDRYGFDCKAVICKSCGLVQTNPRLTQESYNDFYNTEYRPLYGGTETATEKFFQEQYEHGKRIYDYLKPYLPKEGLILEIGCGAGGILQYFKDRGYRVKGVDLAEEYVVYGRDQHGLDLQAVTLEGLNPSLKPDVIIYSHVLEHILKPDEELKRLRDFLSESAILYIEIPGVKNLSKHYMMDFLRYLQNAHTYYFSLTSLRNLAEKQGYVFIKGDEEVRSIFKKSAGNAAAATLKNDYRPTLSFLKRFEFLRRFYKISPAFILLVLRRVLGKK